VYCLFNLILLHYHSKVWGQYDFFCLFERNWYQSPSIRHSLLILLLSKDQKWQ